MSKLSLILASSSPQRRKLLSEANYSFVVIPPRELAECGVCSATGPMGLVSELALRKGADVLQQLIEEKKEGKLSLPTTGQVIVACDTVAECGGQILGKPADQAHACSMLQRLRGEEHRVYSGLAVWSLPFGPLPTIRDNSLPSDSIGRSPPPIPMPTVRVATTTLRMDQLTDCQIDDYLASGLWEGKAGAFGYQDRAGWLHIENGSESNVIGLPMELLGQMLAEIGDLG